MTLRCNLSGHDAVSVELVNQGFQFSRCRRCRRDLVKSASSAAAEWQAVPRGFRVAWGDTDLSVFRHATLAERSAARVREWASTVYDAGYLVSAMSWWFAVDTGRRMRGVVRDTATHLRPIPRLAGPKRQWVVVVSLPMGRGLRLEQYEAQQNDAAAA